ncbi:MAG: 50S ribosomal protein L11 methyltransferase [Pseudomonadota bacterium]
MADDPQNGEDQGVKAFVADNTVVGAPSLVPEVRLHLASEALALWHKTEALAGEGLPPPFWAFAWAGGQALARHVIDTPDLVAGKTVLDLGAGGGLVAIAARQAGARRVRANEVDRFALAAIGMNAALNAALIEVVASDLLDGPAGADVVLVGDLFYEKALAARALAFLERAAKAGATVLIGDPSRSYLPQARLLPVATFSVPTPRALEDADVKRTTVWTLREG